MSIPITSVNILFQNMESHWIFKSEHISFKIFMTACTVYINFVKYSWNHRTYLLNIKICMHHWNIQSLFISWKWRTVHVGWIFKSHTMYNINWIFKTVHTRVCHHASSYTFIYVPCLFSQASSSFLVCGIILKEVKATAWSECKVYWEHAA